MLKSQKIVQVVQQWTQRVDTSFQANFIIIHYPYRGIILRSQLSKYSHFEVQSCQRSYRVGVHLVHCDWKETPCVLQISNPKCHGKYENALDSGEGTVSRTTISGNSHSPLILIRSNGTSPSPPMSRSRSHLLSTRRQQQVQRTTLSPARTFVYADRVRIWLWSIIPFSACLQTHHSASREVSICYLLLALCPTCSPSWRERARGSEAQLVPLSCGQHSRSRTTASGGSGSVRRRSTWQSIHFRVDCGQWTSWSHGSAYVLCALGLLPGTNPACVFIGFWAKSVDEPNCLSRYPGHCL